MLVLLATSGLNSYRDLRTARQREAELGSRILEVRQRIDELDERIVRLQEDPATLERLAREELGLVEPGEVVIVLPDYLQTNPGEP